MINAFMAKNEMHAVYVIQRDGIAKIRAKGFCGAEDDDKLSVYQVPDWAFDGRPKYGQGGTPVCVKCAATVTTLRSPPR